MDRINMIKVANMCRGLIPYITQRSQSRRGRKERNNRQDEQD